MNLSLIFCIFFWLSRISCLPSSLGHFTGVVGFNCFCKEIRSSNRVTFQVVPLFYNFCQIFVYFFFFQKIIFHIYFHTYPYLFGNKIGLNENKIKFYLKQILSHLVIKKLFFLEGWKLVLNGGKIISIAEDSVLWKNFFSVKNCVIEYKVYSV